MKPTRTYVLPQDLEDDARAGRVGSILLDFEISSELGELKSWQRFRALARCPSHRDDDPSLVVTVLGEPHRKFPAGAVLHTCPVCDQDQVRDAMGESAWRRWFPGRKASRRWKSKRAPALLHQLAIQAQHRELLRRGEEMTTLLRNGITVDAIQALRVGFAQLDPKSWPLDVKSLDRLAFFLQDDGYVGRQLYSLALAKGTHRRKLTHGRGGLTMRRGGPAAGPIVVVEGCMARWRASRCDASASGFPARRGRSPRRIECSSIKPRSS